MTKRKGYLFQRKPGGNYYVQFNVDGNRFTKSTGTANRRKAERVRNEIMQPFAMGDEEQVYKSVAVKLEETTAKIDKLDRDLNPPPTISKVFLRFMKSPERPDAGERTLQGYQSSWTRFTRWMTDQHPDIEYLHEIEPQMAKDYAKHLKAAKVSASTFNQHKNLLRMVWRVMAEECRLTDNPWSRVQSMKLAKSRETNKKQSLTNAQFDSLLAAVADDQELEDLFQFLAFTGLRLSDGVLVRWGSINFNESTIKLTPRKTSRTTGKQVLIPIFPQIAEMLNRRQGQLVNERGYVFERLAHEQQSDPQKLSKRIQQAFESAGMQTKEERAGLKRKVVVYGAHSLRHFFVSMATDSGMPPAMIRQITGHSTDRMLNHYQHINEKLVQSFAQNLTGQQMIEHEPDTDGKLVRVNELASSMNSKNWKRIKESIIEITGGQK